MHTATNKTLHTGDPHHTEVSQEVTVDPDHTHHTNTPTKHYQNCPTVKEQNMVCTSVKVQIDVYYNTMYVVLCLFLDNSDSPSIVEQ